MRRKAPDGLTTIERAMLARLKKGPAALHSLAHAARCSSSSVKVHISRLRRKLKRGITIPRSFYGNQTYHLEVSTASAPSPRNNLLCVSDFLPDYILCEWFRFPSGGAWHLARAIMLRTLPRYGVK